MVMIPPRRECTELSLQNRRASTCPALSTALVPRSTSYVYPLSSERRLGWAGEGDHRAGVGCLDGRAVSSPVPPTPLHRSSRSRVTSRDEPAAETRDRRCGDDEPLTAAASVLMTAVAAVAVMAAVVAVMAAVVAVVAAEVRPKSLYVQATACTYSDCDGDSSTVLAAGRKDRWRRRR